MGQNAPHYLFSSHDIVPLRSLQALADKVMFCSCGGCSQGSWRPKHHPRSYGFAVFVFQVNDLHGDACG
jgi:hypothetical protein